MVSDVSKKDIGRCYKFITKELEQAMGTIHAADYMRRFGSRLGLANKEMQAAEEAAHIACPRDGRCAWAGLLACVSSASKVSFCLWLAIAEVKRLPSRLHKVYAPLW